MDWTLLGKNTYVTMIGFCNVIMYKLSGNEAVLIDSGSSDSPQLRDYFKEQGIHILAVLYTHLHIDHIKNRGWLKDEHGTRLYASKDDIECKDNTEHVKALPLDLKRPFTINGASFEIMRTPGHTPGSISIVTPDNVCCIGDAMISLDVLGSSRFPYMCDAREAVESMISLKKTAFKFYVPAHSTIVPGEEFEKTAGANIEKELEIFRDMTAFVKRPAELDALSDAYLEHMGISMRRRGGIWNEVFMSEVRARYINLCEMGKLKRKGNIISPL